VRGEGKLSARMNPRSPKRRRKPEDLILLCQTARSRPRPSSPRPSDAYREPRYRYFVLPMLTGSPGILTAGLGILTGRAGIDTLSLRCLPGAPVSLPRVSVSFRESRYRYFVPPMLTGSLGILTAGLGILTGSAGIDTLSFRCLREPRYPYRGPRYPYRGPRYPYRGPRYPYRVSRYRYFVSPMLTGSPGIDTFEPGSAKKGLEGRPRQGRGDEGLGVRAGSLTK
jgi:hypothetical protein